MIFQFMGRKDRQHTNGSIPLSFTLSLNPSPKEGEGLLIRLPFSLFGRRGWGMRAVNLQKWDAPFRISILGIINLQ